MKYLILTLCVSLSFGAVFAESRTWTSADGSKTFEGQFKSLSGNKVTVIRAGRMLTFELSMLSEKDQAWLRENAAKKKNASASAREVEEFIATDFGKAVAKAKVLDGKRFGKFEFESVPEYFILYVSASW